MNLRQRRPTSARRLVVSLSPLLNLEPRLPPNLVVVVRIAMDHPPRAITAPPLPLRPLTLIGKGRITNHPRINRNITAAAAVTPIPATAAVVASRVVIAIVQRPLDATTVATTITDSTVSHPRISIINPRTILINSSRSIIITNNSSNSRTPLTLPPICLLSTT